MNRFKRYIGDLFFNLFLKIFSKKDIQRKIYFPSNAKILIVNFSDIQHSLNITPFIKILSQNFNSTITLFTLKETADVFTTNKYVASTIIYNKAEKKFIKILSNLLSRKYDVIIDPDEDLNILNSYAVGLLRSKFKVGFAKKSDSLFSHRIPLLEKNKIHVVDRILHLADSFEMEINKSDLNIYYSSSEKSRSVIEKYFIQHDLLHKFTAVVNISNKMELGFWGFDNYKNLLKYLRNYDINIIIVSSIEDIEVAEKIAEKSNLIFYNTDLDIYAELLKNSNFIFSPDSYTIQLAAAFKVPTFCLFVQHKVAEMINVPYNSDFDFALTEKDNLKSISYGKVLNSFVPYFEYVFERYSKNSTN